MWYLLVQPDSDIQGRRDPENVRYFIDRIETFEYTDVDEQPFCEPVILLALRNAQFDVDNAIIQLYAAANPNPITTASASTPGQEEWMRRFMPTDRTFGRRNDPVNMKRMIAALRIFDLNDEQGRPLCVEVLETVIRAASYRVFRAAEILLIHTKQYTPEVHWGPWVGQREAVAGMKEVYPGVERDDYQGVVLHKLFLIASRITELEPHYLS
jgi:hypothetical protein